MAAYDSASFGSIEVQMEEKPTGPTMKIPAAGRYFYGMSRGASYRAALRGDIPTITVGKRKLALVAALERKLEKAAEASGGKISTTEAVAS
jgi:hypothetical protein